MNIHVEATEQYLPEILFIFLYKVKSYGVTIQMKANEWLFNVLLFILLYKEVITLSLWMKSYGVTIRVLRLLFTRIARWLYLSSQ